MCGFRICRALAAAALVVCAMTCAPPGAGADVISLADSGQAMLTGYAYIDFDYYGLLGWCFKERIYAGVWPEQIKYLPIGPFVAENSKPADPTPESGQGTVAIFPQFGYNHNCHLTEAFMAEFIEMVTIGASPLPFGLFVEAASRRQSG